jgi:hypothetical protein
MKPEWECHFGKKSKGQDHKQVQIGKTLGMTGLKMTWWQRALEEVLSFSEKWCTKHKKNSC